MKEIHAIKQHIFHNQRISIECVVEKSLLTSNYLELPSFSLVEFQVSEKTVLEEFVLCRKIFTPGKKLRKIGSINFHTSMFMLFILRGKIKLWKKALSQKMVTEVHLVHLEHSKKVYQQEIKLSHDMECGRI